MTWIERGGGNEPNLTGFTLIGRQDRRIWPFKACATAAVTVWATVRLFRQPTTMRPIGFCRSPQYEANGARTDLNGGRSRRQCLVEVSGSDLLQLPLDLGIGRPRSRTQRAVQIVPLDCATSPSSLWCVRARVVFATTGGVGKSDCATSPS